jgi:hypothetical protein
MSLPTHYVEEQVYRLVELTVECVWMIAGESSHTWPEPDWLVSEISYMAAWYTSCSLYHLLPL